MNTSVKIEFSSSLEADFMASSALSEYSAGSTCTCTCTCCGGGDAPVENATE